MDSNSTTARPAFVRAAATIAIALTAAGIFSIARAQNFFSPNQPPRAVSPNNYPTPAPQANPGAVANTLPSAQTISADAFRAGGATNSGYLDALWQDEFNGNPEVALHDYQALVDRYDAQRRRAVEDLLKLGELEHAKGRSNAARACFARILREFVDFPQFTDAARQYLAVSRPEPELPLQQGGIGAVLSIEGSYPKVQQILPESAAAKEGRLHVGDSITGVGQEGGDITLTSHMKMEQVVAMIRGPVGTTVRLLVVTPNSDAGGSTPANSDDLSGARIVELQRTPIAAPESPTQPAYSSPFGIGSAAVVTQNGTRDSAQVFELMERRVKLLEEQLELTKRQIELGTARNADLDALRKKLDEMQQRLSDETRAHGTPEGQPDVPRTK
jgi:hypothetical protein